MSPPILVRHSGGEPISGGDGKMANCSATRLDRGRRLEAGQGLINVVGTWPLRASLVMVAFLIGVAALAAQTNTGQLGGVVIDSGGVVLPGATVTATRPESGFTIERVTDGSGRFFLPALPVGEYTISVVMPGFSGVTRTGIVLAIGRTLEFEFTLGIGFAEEVTVVAPRLQVTTAEISDVIENRQVVQIPLSGRQFLQLAQLSDAVVIPPGGTRGAALEQAGPLPNVGGQRAGHNIYMLDGFKITDELFNNLAISPSVDSIQEFKIQKTMYPVEFGGKASALINVVTKSGTNTFHGSVFEFVRNDKFDAHNFFDDKSEPVPPLRQNQFGFSLGGPVGRDRSFFFLSYEGQRGKRSLTRTFSVPPEAIRRGDFSGFDPICDPVNINPATGQCVPFTGNQIPTDRIDPIARTFLEKVPLPTRDAPFQNLTSVEKQVTDLDQFSLRVDHRISQSDYLFARFSTFDADEFQPFGTSELNEILVPGFGRSVTTTSRNLGLSYTHTFGNSVLNEFRFGWLDVSGGQASENEGVDFAGQTGLLGVATDPRDIGFPQISTSSLYSTMGDQTSFISRKNTHFEIYNNVLIDRGIHRIKFGGYYFHLKFRPLNPEAARGSFAYTGQWTGNAFADFLLGYPKSARAGIGGRGDEDGRTNWLHTYIQDDWRLRSNLTVNYGLRYEINQHMRDVNNRLSTIDFSVPGGRYVIASGDDGNISPMAEALLPLIPIPWVTSAEIGWDRGLLRPSYRRYAPRVGFALTLGDAGLTVVRGGYGIFLNQWAYSVQTAFTRNLPFFFLKQVEAAADDPIPTLATRDILTADPTGSIGGAIMDHDGYRTEYTQTWSVGLQQALSPNTVIEGFYMGSYTTGADNSTVRNVPVPGPGPIDPRRPVPQLSGISMIRFDGWSVYHALTLKTEKRFSNGYSLSANYTWSKSLDDASSPGPTEAETNRPQDVRNLDAERGLSSFDRRHVVVASGIYEFPFLEGAGGWQEALGGGWRLSAIVTLQTGAPFTVNLGTDNANIGSGPAQRPNVSHDPNLSSNRTPQRWFDPDTFTLPAPFTFGNAARNVVFGPGFANVDASLQKDWRFTDGVRLEFRWEVFNLFNRANFDLPNRIAFTPNVGRIFSAKNPREMQFGLRLAF